MPEASLPRSRSPREIAGAAVLILLGLAPRLLFARAFPTLPFWDSLQLIHFGELMQSNGITAPGWYWSQFNPGVPMILVLLFETGLPHAAVARLATASVTGLLGILPFLIWRGVLGFRWRLLAGALLALWPGQIFFSGVVVQDNWVLLPTVALACLAVRRLRSPRGLGWPVIAAMLFAASFAIRQEMLVALAPLALAAGISRRDSGRRPRDAAILATTVVLLALLLCLQRREATGRFTLATEHGALGLFGSFMPGAGAEGWIDGRAYAAAREPSASRGLFGSPEQLVRLTAEEVERRPGFHALRIASWLPRLALGADADALLWSLGAPRALDPALRPRADAFARFARPLLLAELALVQGAFAAALLVGLARRRPDILVVAIAVALKFAIHMVVSPLGRLVVPAIALELIAIPLGAEALASLERRESVGPLALAAVVAAGLLVMTPPLAALVARRDARELHGVRSFLLDGGEGCAVRCELRQGALAGLTPIAATFSGALDCFIPILPSGSDMELAIEGGRSRVLAHGHGLSPSSTGTWLLSGADAVSAELPAGDAATVRFRVAARTTPAD